MRSLGLRDVRTEDLKTLLKLLHRGDLPCPLKKSTLMGMGMDHVAVVADTLMDLDERGVRAVLVAVLAERQ